MAARTPDDWVFVAQLVSWLPYVTATDATMHSGILATAPKMRARRMGVACEPLSMILNVYDAVRVFRCSGYWIVDETVRDIVEPLVRAEFADTVVIAAFSCPYGPHHDDCDRVMEASPYFPEIDTTIRHVFVPRFECDIPRRRYFEWRMPYIGDIVGDVQSFDTWKNAPPEATGVSYDPMLVSPSILKEHGILKSLGGLAVTPAVFAALAPLLQKYYYWAHPYRFAGQSRADADRQ